jgi:hypothetical protein
MGNNLTGQLISATYEDLVQISGSARNFLTDGTGSNITSLAVTASFATSASFAQTASFALNTTPINTGSFVTTASISNADITFTKADASTFSITVNNVSNASTASIATSASFANNATSASFATTASFAQTALLANNGFPFTGSAVITGSLSVTGSTEIVGSVLATGGITTKTALYLQGASGIVTTALENAGLGDLKVRQNSGDINRTITLEGFANLVSTGTTNGTTISGSFNSAFFSNQVVAPSFTGSLLGTASFANNATSASYALTASFATNATPTFPFTGSARITGSLSVEGTLVSGLGNASNVVANGGAAIATSGSNADGILTAVIGGFNNDTGNTEYSVVAGGTNNNIADGQNWSFIGGGENNSVNAGVSVIVGGNNNSVNGFKAGVFSGENNIAGNQYSVVVGGNNNNVSHNGSVILGGSGLTTTAANQAVVQNLRVTGSAQITGSLNITGSLFLNGIAVTTSGSGGTVDTGSLMVTGSVTTNVLTFTKGDGSTFALTVDTGSGGTVNTGSLLVTASISNATTTYTKGDGSTFALTVNNVQNASTASIATSASFATNALTASYALTTDLGTSATASFTGSTWTFDHNLNQQYVLIAAYDSSNNAIIPQTVNLTSANQAVISFPTSVQGVAVASLGNGVTSSGGGGATAAQLWGSVQAELANKWTYTQDYTYTPTNEQIITVHVSSSGIHLIDLTSVTTSASVNVLFYPESLPTYSVAGVAWKLPANGTAATRGVFRAQVTASATTEYWLGQATPFTATSQNIQTVATNLVMKRLSTNTVQPTAMIKGADNTNIVMGYLSAYSTTIMYPYTGSNGTPIV